MGAKKQPFYRIVVADSRSPRDGRFIETVGHYNPLTEPATIVMDARKVNRWIANGAQPTVVVSKLMRRAGITGAAEQPAASDAVLPAAPVVSPIAPTPETVPVREAAEPSLAPSDGSADLIIRPRVVTEEPIADSRA